MRNQNSLRAAWASNAFLCALTVVCAGCNGQKQPTRDSDPTRQTESSGQRPTIAQQKACADQARVSFSEFRTADKTDIVVYDESYTDHFDVSTTTCYVEFLYTFSLDRGSTMTVSKTVQDAFEGREYATYIWSSKENKKYWDVPPEVCSVKPRTVEDGLI